MRNKHDPFTGGDMCCLKYRAAQIAKTETVLGGVIAVVFRIITLTFFVFILLVNRFAGYSLEGQVVAHVRKQPEYRFFRSYLKDQVSQSWHSNDKALVQKPLTRWCQGLDRFPLPGTAAMQTLQLCKKALPKEAARVACLSSDYSNGYIFARGDTAGTLYVPTALVLTGNRSACNGYKDDTFVYFLTGVENTVVQVDFLATTTELVERIQLDRVQNDGASAMQTELRTDEYSGVASSMNVFLMDRHSDMVLRDCLGKQGEMCAWRNVAGTLANPVDGLRKGSEEVSLRVYDLLRAAGVYNLNENNTAWQTRYDIFFPGMGLDSSMPLRLSGIDLVINIHVTNDAYCAFEDPISGLTGFGRTGFGHKVEGRWFDTGDTDKSPGEKKDGPYRGCLGMHGQRKLQAVVRVSAVTAAQGTKTHPDGKKTIKGSQMPSPIKTETRVNGQLLQTYGIRASIVTTSDIAGNKIDFFDSQRLWWSTAFAVFAFACLQWFLDKLCFSKLVFYLTCGPCCSTKCKKCSCCQLDRESVALKYLDKTEHKTKVGDAQKFRKLAWKPPAPPARTKRQKREEGILKESVALLEQKRLFLRRMLRRETALNDWGTDRNFANLLRTQLLNKSELGADASEEVRTAARRYKQHALSRKEALEILLMKPNPDENLFRTCIVECFNVLLDLTPGLSSQELYPTASRISGGWKGDVGRQQEAFDLMENDGFFDTNLRAAIQ